MKKTLLSLGFVAMIAAFTSCGNCETDTTEQDVTAVETENALKDDAKCGEGKMSEEKTEKVDKFAQMDADGNDEISKEEFVTYITKEFSGKDKNEDGKITEDECGHFEMLNTDGDDSISDEEFTAGQDVIFSNMDTDGNESISREEMKAHMEKMMSASSEGEHKCGEGKCGEGKCGEGK